MALDYETVGIPLVSGIKPQARARMLDPGKLLIAQNCYYLKDQGPQKRNGHTERVVHTSAPYPGSNPFPNPTAVPSRDLFDTADPQIPAAWVFGWGTASVPTSSDPYQTSSQPDVGQLFGVGARDTELAAWDGHRVFSLAPQQASLLGESLLGSTGKLSRRSVVLPMLRSSVIAKVASAQTNPDSADNGKIRTVVWITPGTNLVSYSAFDSSNGAPLVTASVLTTSAANDVRLLTVGDWTHILVSSTTSGTLELRSFHSSAPAVIVSRSLGSSGAQFDVKKVTEMRWVVLRGTSPTLNVLQFNADGTSAGGFIPTLGGAGLTAGGAMAIEADVSGNYGIIWFDNPNVRFAVYNTQGSQIAAATTVLATGGTNRRMTLSARYLPIGTGVIWDVFDEEVNTVNRVTSLAVVQDGPTVTTTTLTVCRNAVLASHAFRVGQRTFVWSASSATSLQRTWFLCDAGMRPVGKMAYGLATIDTSAANTLPGVHWIGTGPAKDRIVFNGALPVNQRVTSNTSRFVPNGVFAETSVQAYKLDFLPPFRAAQAGRCMYVAGAQLWAYDGAEVVEAGFHQAPEGVSFTAVGTAGGLQTGGAVYRYRVDLCHKNAQNEEVRSWSLVTTGTTTAAGTIQINVPTMPFTRKSDDSYLLFFRTEGNGTVYYLANSRDPANAGFVLNNLAVNQVSYTDQLSDASLISGEYHPANSAGNYLDPLPAPACEIVAGGRDRLWLAGGDLSPGEIAPSRLFQPGETPTFSPGVNIQVDRNAEPITAIGFLAGLACVFRRTSTYIVDSDGPDNSLNQQWAPPRLAIADTGAVSQETLGLTTFGLWFQSPAGVRLLTNSGTMDATAGTDMDPVLRDAKFCGCTVVPQYTQIRWYSKDGTAFVLDYSSNSWCTWTISCAGAVFWPVTNLVVLAKAEGSFWLESPDVFTDAGSAYEMVVRFGWLHAGSAGDFQAVRRWALFGECTPPLSLRARLFYNERPFHEEEIQFSFLGADGNTDAWGTGNWGDGLWGDANNPSGADRLWLRDSVFRVRHRPVRRKCSVFSIEFSDQGALTDGFQPVMLALEIGKKQGLDRIGDE